MRVVNKNFETITEYDLSKGYLINVIAIREDAKPIDNITKYAWADSDYEAAQMYINNPIVDNTAPIELHEKIKLFLESISEEPYPETPPSEGYVYERTYSVEKNAIIWVETPIKCEYIYVINTPKLMGLKTEV